MRVLYMYDCVLACFECACVCCVYVCLLVSVCVLSSCYETINVKHAALTDSDGLTPNAQELRRTTRKVSSDD